MNPRTIYLLIGAGVVGLLYFGDSFYRTYVEKPTADREKKLKKIEDAIENANVTIASSTWPVPWLNGLAAESTSAGRRLVAARSVKGKGTTTRSNRS